MMTSTKVGWPPTPWCVIKCASNLFACLYIHLGLVTAPAPWGGYWSRNPKGGVIKLRFGPNRVGLLIHWWGEPWSLQPPVDGFRALGSLRDDFEFLLAPFGIHLDAFGIILWLCDALGSVLRCLGTSAGFRRKMDIAFLANVAEHLRIESSLTAFSHGSPQLPRNPMHVPVARMTWVYKLPHMTILPPRVYKLLQYNNGHLELITPAGF